MKKTSNIFHKFNFNYVIIGMDCLESLEKFVKMLIAIDTMICTKYIIYSLLVTSLENIKLDEKKIVKSVFVLQRLG